MDPWFGEGREEEVGLGREELVGAVGGWGLHLVEQFARVLAWQYGWSRSFLKLVWSSKLLAARR